MTCSSSATRSTPISSTAPRCTSRSPRWASDVAARTVTLTSATKAFNIAGLRTAVAHIGPAWLRERWDAEPPDIHGVAGVLGVEATLAAWRDGDDMAGRRRRPPAAQPGQARRRPHAPSTACACEHRRRVTSPGSTVPARDRASTSPHSCRSRPSSTPARAPTTAAPPDWVRLNFATSSTLLDDIIGRMTSGLS